MYFLMGFQQTLRSFVRDRTCFVDTRQYSETKLHGNTRDHLYLILYLYMQPAKCQ